MNNLIIGILLTTTLALGGLCIFQRIQFTKETERSIKYLYPNASATVVSKDGIKQWLHGNSFTCIDYSENGIRGNYTLLFRLTYCGSTKTEDLYLISKSSVPELKNNDIIRFAGGTQIILKTDFSTCSLTTESRDEPKKQ